MHERFLLHFGIKLKKVADHSERKKKKWTRHSDAASWNGHHDRTQRKILFLWRTLNMSNWSWSSFLNKEILASVLYITDDNCAHLYNRRELYTISVAWLRLEAFGLIIRSLERKRQQWWFLLWCPVPEQTSNFHSHATLIWQASHKELMA